MGGEKGGWMGCEKGGWMGCEKGGGTGADQVLRVNQANEGAECDRIHPLLVSGSRIGAQAVFSVPFSSLFPGCPVLSRLGDRCCAFSVFLFCDRHSSCRPFLHVFLFFRLAC